MGEGENGLESGRMGLGSRRIRWRVGGWGGEWENGFGEWESGVERMG